MQDVSGFFPAKHGAIPKLSAFPVSSWQVPPGTLFPPCLFLSAFLLWVRNRGLTLPLETPVFHFIGLKPVALSPQQVRFSFSLFPTFFHLQLHLLSTACFLTSALQQWTDLILSIITSVPSFGRNTEQVEYPFTVGGSPEQASFCQKGPCSPACPTESLCTSTKVQWVETFYFLWLF